MVSIIIPVYNSENVIQRCLDSILNQSLTNIEIIIVNDGSTDKSEKVCLEYANIDNRIIYIFQENAGVSAARELGLKNSSGNYVIFIDSDDWIEKDMLENMKQKLKKKGADIVICGYKKENIKGELLFESILDDYKTEISKIEAINNMLDYKGYKGYIWNKMFSRNILLSEGIFEREIHFCEDMLFLVNIILKSNKIIIDKNNYYHYIINNYSITQKKFSKKKMTSLRAIDKIINILEKEKLDNKDLKGLYTNISISLLAHGISLGKINAEEVKLLKKMINKYPEVNQFRLKLSRTLININMKLFIFCWKVINYKKTI